MIAKLKAILLLLKKGRVVTDPAKWKNRQVTSTILVGVIWALADTARAFGYEIPLDDATVDGLALGILSVSNVLFTIVTSDKVGL